MRAKLTIIALLLPLLLWAGMGQGQKNVAAAGSAETLSSSSVPVVWVTIQAKCSNTGSIYVGGSGVNSANGVEMFACDYYPLPSGKEGAAYYNLNQVYINSSVSGEGVKFTYFYR